MADSDIQAAKPEADMTFRQSDLATFIGCKRQFYLEWVEKFYPQPKQTEQDPEVIHIRDATNSDIGTLTHRGVEAHYRGELEGEEGVSLNDLLYNKLVDMGGSVTEKSWVSTLSYAEKMVEGYIDWVEREGVDNRLNLLDVERRLFSDVRTVGSTRAILTGQVDLLFHDELLDRYMIGDTKTKDKFDPPHPNDFQLLTYGVLWMEEDGIIPETAFHNQIKRSKRTARATPPFYERFPIPLDEDILLRHQKRVNRLIADAVEFVEAVREDPEKHYELAFPNLNTECSWKCSVQEICRVMDGHLPWREFAQDHYRPKETPVDLNTK